MHQSLIHALNEAFKRCSDCQLHHEYEALLATLNETELTQALVDFLLEKITSKKLIWEVKLHHLNILLRNPSTRNFDLKDFFARSISKCRRPALKIFLIRGYAMYATEDELIPVMAKFCTNLEKYHDYIDFEHILSVAGLPFLAKTYPYPCIQATLEKAKAEYQKIDPLLRGFFTINENLEHINLLSFEAIKERYALFLKKQHP